MSDFDHYLLIFFQLWKATLAGKVDVVVAADDDQGKLMFILNWLLEENFSRGPTTHPTSNNVKEKRWEFDVFDFYWPAVDGRRYSGVAEPTSRLQYRVGRTFYWSTFQTIALSEAQCARSSVVRMNSMSVRDDGASVAAWRRLFHRWDLTDVWIS